MGPKGSVRRYHGDRHSDAAADDDGSGVAWDGTIEQHTWGRGQHAPNSVEYYQDFMKVFSDGVRVHVLNNLQQGGAEESCWSTHGERCPIYSEDLEDIQDSIRKSAERSNRVGGFFYFAQDTSVWGHISKYLLEDSQQEFHGRSTYLFATRSESGFHAFRSNKRKGLLQGLAVAHLSELVDLYVPMHDSLRYFRRPQPTYNLFQSSLVNAMGIFGSTIPFMKKSQGLEMHYVASLLTGRHQCPLASMDLILPTYGNVTIPVTDHQLRYDIDKGERYDFISNLGNSNGNAILHQAKSVGSGCLEASSYPEGLPLNDSISEMLPGISGDDSSLHLTSILGSTTSFAQTLTSVKDQFVMDAAPSLCESWGVSKEDVMESAEVLTNMAEKLLTS